MAKVLDTKILKYMGRFDVDKKDFKGVKQAVMQDYSDSETSETAIERVMTTRDFVEIIDASGF